jgi:hypothetical protein
MKPILQLHLQDDSEKAGAPNLPRPEREEPRPEAPTSKRLNKFVNRATHKAATHSSRGGSGMFTK